MRLKDLKTGMRIVTRDREEYIVLKSVKLPSDKIGDMFVCLTGGYMSSNSYNEDMTAKSHNKQFDIIKVFAQNGGEYIDARVLSGKTEDMDLIWERKDKKEMTIAEIEKELGYPIKIIK